MNSKLGMFSVLILGVMMLLIPASSLANAQEYDYDADSYVYDTEKIDREKTSSSSLESSKKSSMSSSIMQILFKMQADTIISGMSSVLSISIIFF